MAIIVVGGSGKDVGKTGLVCAVIAALQDFDWTAVKITGHDYVNLDTPDRTSHISQPVIREETRAGQGTDTARYLAAGAKRALLVTRSADEVPIQEIRAALGDDRNVIFESNRIVEYIKPDLCLAVAGGDANKPSFKRLLDNAHGVVRTGEHDGHRLAEGIPLFQLASLDRLTDEMIRWMRQHLARG